MNYGLIIGGIILVICVVYYLVTYNNLVRLNNKVKESFATMDVYLKKRWDLIPNIVETVKGYAKHEKETFDNVIKARNNFNKATTKEEEIAAGDALSGALTKLFALAEAYPELKANENYLELQEELKETEDKVAMARRLYNDTVLSLNNKVEMFPSNIVAKMFSFKKEDFLKTEEKDKKVPEVKF